MAFRCFTAHLFQFVLKFLGTCNLIVEIPFADIHAVAHKHRATLMEIEFNVTILGFKKQIAHPFPHNRSDLVFRGHLTADVYALDKSCIEIFAERYGSNQGRAEYLSVLDGYGKKGFEALVSHFLVLNRNADVYVLPAITPIGRNAVLDSLRVLGGGNKNAILSATDKIPTPFTPLIRFFNEKVGGEAEFDEGAGRTILIFQLIGGFAFCNNGRIPSVASCPSCKQNNSYGRDLPFYNRARGSTVLLY